MGEVWRARDTRLDREVAIKVLPAEVASDASRLKRFEKEARAASSLNHPNIVTIYDLGLTEGVSWIAMEKVEGRTLRELLASGALPVKRVLSIGAQVADGLSKAHEAGIVHRDLKPENVMVTKDGLVKILDFGLAKLTQVGPGSDEGSHLPTETGTSPGVVLGTVGYMSPEQAAGQTSDFRSDQFSFGSILYEMATGKRAFQKKTAIDTLSAILNEAPTPVAEINPLVPAPLRWIVERCLAKEPEERYASTRDLARDLATMRDRLSEAVWGPALIAPPRRRRGQRTLAIAVASLLAAALGLAAYVLGRGASPPPSPQFQRLTFRRGFVNAARFSPDGQTIVYSARWEGEPPHVFLTRPDSPESQKLDLPDAMFLSISSRGEIALLRRKQWLGPPWGLSGTLATAPLTGGAPREVAEDVVYADWAPDGKAMLVRRIDGLEFPLGKVIHKGGFIPRLSPSGDRIAFGAADFPAVRVHVTDLAGKDLAISRPQERVSGIAWSPSGNEVWFTARSGGAHTLRAVSVSGKERVLLRMPQEMTVEDVSRDGRVLMGFSSSRWETWARPAGEAQERDLTVLANSNAMALSRDGKALLIVESAAPNRPETIYLRSTDGSPPKKLGEGFASELSPDNRWALVVRRGPPMHLVLVPTGAGEERPLERGSIEWYERLNIRWSGDGRRLLFQGLEKGNYRMYVQDIAGGGPRLVGPVAPEGDVTGSISHDGRFVILQLKGESWIYPVEGGERRAMPGILKTEAIWRNWSEDSRFVYAWDWGELPFRVFRVELATGRREPWKTIMPQDPAGIQTADLMLSPDGQSYAYNAARTLEDLFLVTGIR